MKHRVLLLGVLLCIVPAVALSQAGNWTIPLTVADGVNTQVLNFGVHPSGSIGFDSGFDVLAPPSPPPGAFDARLRVLAPPNDFFTDVRSATVVGADTVIWTAVYAPATPQPSVTISWVPANLLGKVASAVITDNITGTLFTQDMLTTTSVNSSNPLIASSLRIRIIDPRMPITLGSFTARYVASSGVRIDWVTLSEINNYGFEIQRRPAEVGDLTSLPGVFIPGHGTTTEPRYYSYTDASAAAGSWEYRLRQIDLDGTVSYGPIVQVDVPTGVGEGGTMPSDYALLQNYPNPFNPSTEIRYTLPVASAVVLKVYAATGEEAAVLEQGVKPAGTHTVTFRAEGLPSGLYVCRMTAGLFNSSIKLLLVR